ncbi:MAG: preprotein translocase subunit SecG [Bacteroidales bacterium]|nr:preprotein translocase subunit SecG [Bacteroidales bacterium]
MYIVLIFIICIVAVLMCLIVLIQNSKGGGLASSFASSNQIMGVRKTTDFLEKATWGLAITIAVLCIFSAWQLPRHEVQSDDSIMLQNAIDDNATNPETLPVYDEVATEPTTAE